MAAPFDPEQAENLQEIDKQFAVKTVEHAQTYWNLITKVPPSRLKLTKIDDEIFDDLKETFPELIDDQKKLEKLDEEAMKSAANKERWRNFMSKYEKKVQDYNFGCLLRVDSKGEYDERNAILVLRMQWYAIEIARNRLALNDYVYEEGQREAEREAKRKAERKAAKAKPPAA